MHQEWAIKPQNCRTHFCNTDFRRTVDSFSAMQHQSNSKILARGTLRHVQINFCKYQLQYINNIKILYIIERGGRGLLGRTNQPEPDPYYCRLGEINPTNANCGSGLGRVTRAISGKFSRLSFCHLQRCILSNIFLRLGLWQGVPIVKRVG